MASLYPAYPPLDPLSIPRFLALYRGGKVGGGAPFKMDALCALYKRLGHEEVRNYIQSGDIVFDPKWFTWNHEWFAPAGRCHSRALTKYPQVLEKADLLTKTGPDARLMSPTPLKESYLSLGRLVALATCKIE